MKILDKNVRMISPEILKNRKESDKIHKKRKKTNVLQGKTNKNSIFSMRKKLVDKNGFLRHNKRIKSNRIDFYMMSALADISVWDMALKMI